MEQGTVNLEQGIQGLAVMSAIPVVVLGLWVDYWGRRVDTLVIEDPAFEKEPELEKLKMVSLCALLSQILLFLGSSEIRDDFPAVSPLIFVVAVSLQMLIQTKAEDRLKVPSNTNESVLKISLRATFYWIFGVTVHICSLGLATVGTALLVQKYQPSFLVGILALALAGISGLVVGIVINMVLAPYYLRHIFPVRKLEDTILKTKIEGCFTSFGFAPPDLWVLELQEIKIAQNIFLGIKEGTKALRPSLFLSNIVLATLTMKELEALTLNQVSHLILEHSKKRGILIFSFIVVATILAILFIILGQSLVTEESIIETIGSILSITIFFTSFRVLYLQTQRHESESDIYTIEKMGVTCENLSSALRKLDLLADSNTLDLSSGSKASVGFPETEIRIKLFEKVKSKEQTDKAA